MDDFLWRVSVAEVESAAPFSAFPGIDRVIALLDGDGFTMTLDDGRVHALTAPCAPFAFPGEAAVHVALAGGPSRDFNLMLRRGRVRGSGVGGPYAIALGPRCFAGLTRTTKGGYPVMEHVRRLLDGPIVWAPAADGAIVMSLRGGDFELTVGQDFSIGYLDHTATTVRLYLQESFTFRVLAPEAAVPLRYPSASAGSNRAQTQSAAK